MERHRSAIYMCSCARLSDAYIAAIKAFHISTSSSQSSLGRGLWEVTITSLSL